MLAELTCYRSAFSGSIIKASVLTLSALVLSGGCAQLIPSERLRFEVTDGATPAPPMDPGDDASHLVASDLVNTLSQVKGLQPGEVNLQLWDDSQAFGKILHNALLTLGYDVTTAIGLPTANMISFSISSTSDNGSLTTNRFSQTYQLNVNDVTIKRDYTFFAGQVEPQSHIYMSGANISGIQLNDAIFTGASQPVQTAVSEAINPSGLSGALAEDFGSNAWAESPFAATNTALNMTGVPSNTSVASSTLRTKSPSSVPVLSMQTHSVDGTAIYRVGEPVRVSIAVTVDSLLYCYYQDGLANIFQVFPNRYAHDNVVYSGQTVFLPDSEHWQLTATHAGMAEQFMCISVNPDSTATLSGIFSMPDLQPLPANDLQEIHDEFILVAGDAISQERISVDVGD